MLIFIIALLAVLLVAGVAFMYVMGEYIEYTPTGIQINWPWLSDAPSAPPEVTDPVVIESDPVEMIVENLLCETFRRVEKCNMIPLLTIDIVVAAV